MGGKGSGGPRKPTALLKLSGTLETHKKAYRDRVKEVQPGGVPEPPVKLPKYAQEFWDRRVPEMIEMGLVRALDSESLYVAAMLWDDYVRLQLSWPLSQRNLEYQRQQNTILQNMHRQLAKFGMTPVDRAGLIAEGDKRATATKKYLA